MSTASSAPVSYDLLCEKCGYVLSGLPAESRCPECGFPIAQSDPNLRTFPRWEQPGQPAWLRFLHTSLSVTFQPARFFRTLATRVPGRPSRNFAAIHYALASTLFGVSAYAHLGLLLTLFSTHRVVQWPVAIAFAAMTLVLLIGLTSIAARLTHWEASYRSLRLPLPAVRRGLDYHSAHYLPVALLTAMTVIGYALLRARHIVDETNDPAYLYILSGEVIVSAGYLFNTYWIGMRNMLYANR